MRIRVSLGILAFAVTSCGTDDPRNDKIADIDFANTSSVQHVAQRLFNDDRKIFGEYVMSRNMAAYGAKETATENGTAPLTVGDAIRAQRSRDDIFAKRNQLVARQNRLIGSDGMTEDKRQEWQHLGNEVDAYDNKLDAMTIK